MLKVKIQGADFNFPTCWEDLTYKQLYSIICLEDTNNYETVRTLLGFNELDFYALQKSVYDALEASLLTWAVDNIDFGQNAPPEIFVYKEKGYALPNEIGRESIAQYKDLQSEISALGTEATHLKIMALYPNIVATYLQPIIDGQYGYSKTKKVADEVWNCRGIDVLAYGNFFLSNLKLLNPTTKPTLQKQKWTLYNVWRDFLKYLKGLGLPTR